MGLWQKAPWQGKGREAKEMRRDGARGLWAGKQGRGSPQPWAQQNGIFRGLELWALCCYSGWVAGALLEDGRRSAGSLLSVRVVALAALGACLSSARLCWWCARGHSLLCRSCDRAAKVSPWRRARVWSGGLPAAVVRWPPYGAQGGRMLDEYCVQRWSVVLGLDVCAVHLCLLL